MHPLLLRALCICLVALFLPGCVSQSDLTKQHIRDDVQDHQIQALKARLDAWPTPKPVTSTFSKAPLDKPSTRPFNNSQEQRHMLRAGETFYAIALRYDTTVAQLQILNPHLDPHQLNVGTWVQVR